MPHVAIELMKTTVDDGRFGDRVARVEIVDRLRDGRAVSAALAREVAPHEPDHRDGPDEHDHSLQEVDSRGGLVASDDKIDAGDGGNDGQRDFHVDMENRLKQIGQAAEHARRIRQKEQEDRQRADEFHAVRAVSRYEELGHGGGAESTRHLSGPLAQDEPREQAAEHGVADADPERFERALPSVRSGKADEHDRAKIRRAVGNRENPRAEQAPAEEKVVGVFGFLHSPRRDDEQR